MVAWIADEDSRNEIPDDGRHVCLKNENTCHRVLSIAQDILYCARQGWIKTPNVLLPIAVQHLTRNAQVVTLLNKFGHGMSYSQVEEVETALAEEDLKDEAVPLPTNIDGGASVVLAVDNNLLEETTTGAKTTHCTNSIVIQRVQDSPSIFF